MIAKIGFNPNLFEDIKTTLGLSSTLANTEQMLSELAKKRPTAYDKLVAFTDRIEFIDHLEHVKNAAIKNDFMFDEHEVHGIDNDIDALKLYLVLSCIDMVAKMRPYETFDVWLTSNCDDFKGDIPLKEYIKKKSIDYYEQEGISSGFRNAILNSSLEIRNKLTANLKTYEKGNMSNDIEDIIQFLKNIRNKYTHEGSRVYYLPASSNCPCIVMIGARIKDLDGDVAVENRSGKSLLINSKFDLVSTLKEIAVQLCKKELNFIV